MYNIDVDEAEQYTLPTHLEVVSEQDEVRRQVCYVAPRVCG